MAQDDLSILERNLGAMAGASPDAVRAIAAAEPRQDVSFCETPDGVLSADLAGRAMASKRRPLVEAKKVAEIVDPESTGMAVCLGFGLGYHARELCERFGKSGAVLCIEPDVGLLRAVLEVVDHSAWIGCGQFALLTDPDDSSAISAKISGLEGLLALGSKFVEHPADRVRLGDRLNVFTETFARVMKGVRSQVLTTLIQVETTLRNVCMNADHYVGSRGIAPMAGVLGGRCAVVVSAGPSLDKNVHLLTEPGVRDRVCIIAVQTMLKPLLALGIRPHFVTALDYSDVSRRFYEGLTEADVEGITLVADPKGNPSILDAFPGRRVCVGNDMLDRLLGDELVPGAEDANRMLKSGATVAHLGYYLARHLGCDPVALIGQDLGFTDGLYYGPGAAIHTVWAGELNEFRSLETLEWERIARQGGLLMDAKNAEGRRVYTDEQLNSYLLQFEKDFREDVARGLTIVDATEGGVCKRDTVVRTLKAYLEAAPSGTAIDALLLERLGGDDERVAGAELVDRLREVRRGVFNIERLSRDTAGLLREMGECHSDQEHVNRLIGRVDANRDEAVEIEPAFQLVHTLNQTGTLNRFKADRAIQFGAGLTALEVQRKQIDRDRQNVEWIGDAAETLGAILDSASSAHAGEQAKATRDPAPVEVSKKNGQRVGVWAVIDVDPDVGGLGTPRDLGAEVVLGQNALRLTLQRVALASELDGIVIATHEVDRVAEIAGLSDAVGGVGSVDGKPVRIVRVARPDLGRRAALGAARMAAASCWRGGFGGATVYDEVLEPARAVVGLEAVGAHAGVVVGADWMLVDPALIDSCAAFHREMPESRKVAFSNAAPGLGAALLTTELIRKLGEQNATLGAALSYLPQNPAPDLMGRPECVVTSVAARDLGCRAIPDSRARRHALASALGGLGDGVLTASSERLAEVLREQVDLFAGNGPGWLSLELCTGRTTSGLRGEWMRRRGDAIERLPMAFGLAEDLIARAVGEREDLVVSFEGAGDPMLHPELPRLIARAKELGAACVHVRTDLLCDGLVIDEAIGAGVDILSVDLMAESAGVYKEIMGVDGFDRAKGQLERLLGERSAALPWIVPRTIRCALTLDEIEVFYNRWLTLAGAVAIDPMPTWARDERVRSLPMPGLAERRFVRERMAVLSSGLVASRHGDWTGVVTSGDAGSLGLVAAWDAVRHRVVDSDALDAEVMAV